MTQAHRSWTIALALALAAPVVAMPVVAQAKEQHAAKVPIAEARAKALKLVAGVVVAEELEFEAKRWIYSFEIKPTGEKGKLIKEVNIDADTGEVVVVATETD